MVNEKTANESSLANSDIEGSKEPIDRAYTCGEGSPAEKHINFNTFNSNIGYAETEREGEEVPKTEVANAKKPETILNNDLMNVWVYNNKKVVEWVEFDVI